MKVVIPRDVSDRDAPFFTEGAIYPVLDEFDYGRRVVVRGDDGRNFHLHASAFREGFSKENWEVIEVPGEDLLTVAVNLASKRIRLEG